MAKGGAGSNVEDNEGMQENTNEGEGEGKVFFRDLPRPVVRDSTHPLQGGPKFKSWS